MDAAKEELDTLVRKAVPHESDGFYGDLVHSLLNNGVHSVNLLEQLDRELLTTFCPAPLAGAVAGALLKGAKEHTGTPEASEDMVSRAIKRALDARDERDIVKQTKYMSDATKGGMKSALRALEMTVIDAPVLDAQDLDNLTAGPVDISCSDFRFDEWPSEVAGTQPYLDYQVEQLTKFGVPFTRRGFKAVNVSQNFKWALDLPDQPVYTGRPDVLVTRNGIANESLEEHPYIVTELKQREEDRQLYRDRHPDSAAKAPPTYKAKALNEYLPQAVVLLLAAMAAGQATCILDLTDGHQHTMLRLSSAGQILKWESLDAAAAFRLQSKLLLDIQTTWSEGRFKLVSPADLPDRLRVKAEVLSKLVPGPGALQEQLDTVLPTLLLPEDRLAAAYDLISAHYPLSPPAAHGAGTLSYFS